MSTTTQAPAKYARALAELDVARVVDRLIRARATVTREYREARRKSHPATEPADLDAARGLLDHARREAIDELVGLMLTEGRP